MNEKREYKTPGGIQVKNWRKKTGTLEKLDIIKVKELLSYTIM
jgi:hypothetical protein